MKIAAGNNQWRNNGNASIMAVMKMNIMASENINNINNGNVNGINNVNNQ
jgi:hypothetical protein